jgi:hypothetical protein
MYTFSYILYQLLTEIFAFEIFAYSLKCMGSMAFNLSAKF